MPTITADTFTEWKSEFAASVDAAEQDDRLAEWTSNRRPANFLAPPLRHRWNGYLKERPEITFWRGSDGKDRTHRVT